MSSLARVIPMPALDYVASPPPGRGMVVAMLSDQPVQLVDLPELPEGTSGQTAALARLTKVVCALLIPNGTSRRLQAAHWSFNAKFYSIR